MLIGEIGRSAMLMLILVVPYVWISSIWSAMTRNPRVTLSSKMAVVAQFLLVGLASACLIDLLITNNFHYAYVVSYTSRSLELIYRIAAFWGGDAGSLLFWLLIMSLYTLVVRFTRHEDSERMLPVVTAIMSFVTMFFVLVLNLAANPFTVLSAAPADGNGLNALLQNPGMTVHPVNLYLGYVGFLVPFAYGMTALILKRADATWLKVTRKWTLISWLFLSCGIIYGAHWSYEELGWGGYWSWDPIENAALMPWLAATAFLHSAIIQERKGMLKAWNVILVSLTFLLTLFGTALTRGGLLWSIHAFANGPMGFWFMSFVGLMTTLTIFVIVWRWGVFKMMTAKFEAVVSKEGSFLLNNVLFLGALFAVFWGTVFPLVSEAVTGTQMLVSGPFYNSVVLPIGVALIFLMGVGPVLAWRRANMKSLRFALMIPAAVAFGVGIAVWVAGYQNLLSLASYMATSFVAASILLEFYRGALARTKITGENMLFSLVRMISKNRRRYGGYVVHLAVVVMVIGFATTGGYSQQVTVNLTTGQQVQIGNYVLTFHGLETKDEPGKVLLQGDMLVQALNHSKNQSTLGPVIGVLKPNVTFFIDGNQPTTNMGLYSMPFADLYVVLDGSDYKTGQSLFEIHLNPLVNFIWFGGYLYILGTFLSLWPERRRKAKPESPAVRNPLPEPIA